MSAFSKLKKVYCINLDRRPDRWEKMQQLSKVACVELARYSAVDGANLTPDMALEWEEKFKSIASAHSKMPLPYLQGQLGCLLSHQNVLQDMLANDYESVMVLEDDAQFHPQFILKFDEFFEQLPADWGLCYLGGSNMKQPHLLSKNIGKATETLSTVGYIITNSFAKNVLLPMLSRKAFDYEVDINFVKLQQEHEMYIFVPRLIYQYESYSDIQMQTVFYKHQADF